MALGRSPEDIIAQADGLVARAFTPAQVGRHLHKQNEFIAHCGREYYGSDTGMRHAIRDAENIEVAAENGHIYREYKAWSTRNPGKDADTRLLSRWESEAKAEVKRQWDRFLNLP